MRCRTNVAVCQHIGQKKAGTDAMVMPENWQRHAVIFATMCPLAYILPATAQAASQASGSLADNYTVPLLLSTLLGGVVFGAFNDRATKKVLEESVSGIRQGILP